ncbi:hypothetical protein MSM1_17785 [Mycobacterium sp. SM1]|uniref:hypothetical protein n=1 Tax=Mycobacterium sp. SM1 TaxID=2816243 RepID=UPI001BCDDA2E|nr:hypothetical protein [Mycobacterium sp. SM1]MBS4730104.1 hypothetical protein [Mycobacterium sp. SM1]
MRIRGRRVSSSLTAWLAALVLLPACGPDAASSGQTSPQRTPATTAPVAVTSTTAIAAAPAVHGALTKKWIDLQIGECLADPAPLDPGVLTVTTVDCATTHQAEVYLRAPMADTPAFAEVANQDCAAGFSEYTGRRIDGSPFTTAYLVDSEQDRTSAATPTPPQAP